MNIPWRCIHIKKEFGVRWLKIFYHNSINGDFFSNESQILFSCTNKMFSLLGRISPSFKINGSYEFLLQYPKIEGYNRWKQSVYILDANESDVGYQANPEDISWNETYWKGMGRSARTEETFIDGSVHLQYWWYAIGAKHNYSSINRFPGPSCSL